MKEKEHSESVIESLKKEIEVMNRTHEQQIEQIETKAKQIEEHFASKIKEMEYLLLQSNKKIQEVEAASELKSQMWDKRENIFQSYMDNQILHVKVHFGLVVMHFLFYLIYSMLLFQN
jgi:kinesin family member C2/C3